jgi:hypothetical protein
MMLDVQHADLSRRMGTALWMFPSHHRYPPPPPWMAIITFPSLPVLSRHLVMTVVALTSKERRHGITILRRITQFHLRNITDRRERDKRRSVQPIKVSSTMPKASLDNRSTSPDIHTPKVDQNGKVKISAPIGGAPIPAGYKFGAVGKDKDKDSAEQSTPSSSDRREKAKSKMFWGFGRPNGMSLFSSSVGPATPSIDDLMASDKNPAPVQPQPTRAIFGTTLDESLEIAQIANLPAIVFRCIQYLESKKADQEEGIYRLSGSSAVIKSLKDRFNSGKFACIVLAIHRLICDVIRLQRETSICLLRMSIGIHMPSRDYSRRLCVSFPRVF